MFFTFFFLLCSVVHANNPFFPIEKLYVQPSLSSNIQKTISTISNNPQLVENLKKIESRPSAYWIDKKEKIWSNVQTIMNNAEKVVFIIYDLPNRDCKALASNGEICCNSDSNCDSFCSIPCQYESNSCEVGLYDYKTSYIDELYALFSQEKYKSKEIILVIEPDSIPNCITNLGQNGCSELTCQTYFDGIDYALKKFSTLPNIVMYLDAAHGGWLGWNNILQQFQALISKQQWTKFIRGFAINVSNYQDLGNSACPYNISSPITSDSYYNFMEILKKKNTTDSCGYDPCDFGSQYNAANNELNYAQLLSWIFQNDKFDSEDQKPHIIIDTGRNGNPESRIGSESCKVWCNVYEAKIGKFPTTYTDIPSLIDAYFWLKTPGESDGCINHEQQEKCKVNDKNICIRYDPNCGTHPENIGYQTYQPCPPEAGQWFDYQIKMLCS